MMVTQIYVVCDYCRTKFRLRWQVTDHKARILIRCPKCNTKIHGYLEVGTDKHLVVYNARETKDDSNVDYVQEISSELVTHKMKPAKEFTDFITPFIRSADVDYTSCFQYLGFVEECPNEAEVVQDLYSANSSRFLKQKLRDESNIYINICKAQIKNYKLNSKVDLLMACHQYIMISLLCSGIDKNIANVMNTILDLSKSHINQVKAFAKLLDNNGYYERLVSKFPELVGIFNKNYISLIAPLMISDIDSIDLVEFGLSSVDYEDLLELYRKSYEFIGEFIIYVVGLNNISERGDYNAFTTGNFDIENKVNQEDKYNRIQSFVKQGERFSLGYCDTLNKIIRNSEAHFGVEYDVITQRINFVNQGKRKTETEELYLLEFAKETIKVFELAVKLWEIAYQLQKNRMACDLKIDWNFGRPSFKK